MRCRALWSYDDDQNDEYHRISVLQSKFKMITSPEICPEPFQVGAHQAWQASPGQHPPHRSLCWDFHCNRERYELVGIYLVWTGITIVMAVKTPGKQIPPGKDVIETPPRQWSELLPLALCDHLLVRFWPHLCDHPGSFLLVVLLTFHTYDIWHIWKIFMVTNCVKNKSDSVYLKVTLLSKSSS